MLENARQNLLSYPAPIAVMTSGGIDSMCLAHLCLTLGLAVTVVHCNHRIRPEAGDDERFVREFARANRLPYLLYACDVPKKAADEGTSLETAGRAFRYEVMRGLVEQGYTVCTAHHADDNAESVLLHILRGSGMRGLCGMSAYENGIARPFLGVTRAEIEAYAQAFGVKYVEDRTNADDAYTRNFIRLRVMPLLNERFSATAVLNRLSENAREADDYLAEQFDANAVRQEGNTVKIGISVLDGVFAERAVRRAMEILGAGDEVGLKTVRAAQSLCKLQSGKRVDLGQGVTAVREYDAVTFARRSAQTALPQPFAEGTFPAFGVAFCAVAPQVKTGTLRFDPDKLPENAVVRYRQSGDRFKPFGSGSKTLKEYLVDKKIPARERDALPLVAAGRDVFVVCGVEIGDAVKLDERSTRAVEVRRV